MKKKLMLMGTLAVATTMLVGCGADEEPEMEIPTFNTQMLEGEDFQMETDEYDFESDVEYFESEYEYTETEDEVFLEIPEEYLSEE